MKVEYHLVDSITGYCIIKYIPSRGLVSATYTYSDILDPFDSILVNDSANCRMLASMPQAEREDWIYNASIVTSTTLQGLKDENPELFI